ncbi:hypothetical protein [Celeribacter halophilus]|uniref:hypothetical protein n=1 Tax=Celeribacter halophilus TaxID=576117 RepID=UPI002FD5740C
MLIQKLRCYDNLAVFAKQQIRAIRAKRSTTITDRKIDRRVIEGQIIIGGQEVYRGLRRHAQRADLWHQPQMCNAKGRTNDQFVVADACCIPNAKFKTVQKGCRELRQQNTFSGQLDNTAVAVKERRSDPVLQPRDMSGNGGLGDRQFLRRTGESRYVSL